MTDPREQDEQEREILAKVAEWPKLLDPRTPAEIDADEREVQLRCDLSASRRALRRMHRSALWVAWFMVLVAALVGFCAGRCTPTPFWLFAVQVVGALTAGAIVEVSRLANRDEP